MAEYIIHKDNKKYKIIKNKKPCVVYKMKPQIKKRKNMLEVKEIILIEKNLQANVCRIKFKHLFHRLFEIVMNILDSDDSFEGDSIIALDEIKRAKLKLLDEYSQFLSKEEIKLMLKKLDYLENGLKNNIINYNNILNYLNEEKKEYHR